MADSPTPRPTASNPCDAALQALQPAFPLGVAYSGGADSTALLHAAARRWPGRVAALHVHHGLQAAADDFLCHAQSQCDAMGVPLHVAHVDARHGPGESPEDAARKARYQALAQLAQRHGMASVALAQHADDQVETVLLALSRGAGLPGLAAMAADFERHDVAFVRPILSIGSQAIRQWLNDAGVAFIEDPSNADTAYTRNRIRHELLPSLERHFPQFRETFARSARHAAQAQSLLAEVAEDDLRAVGDPPAIRALQALTRQRQANVLRHWLRQTHGVAASAAQLEELLNQVAACATRGHRIHIKVGQGHVLRQGDRLAWGAAC
ncbi:MAG: tRNA lysidine(34) synthetase TilS [Burkholderiaceae bacterium]|nr:tRNA lysidine(34) synthetase TilS [Burkholderiaceae bacterium]